MRILTSASVCTIKAPRIALHTCPSGFPAPVEHSPPPWVNVYRPLLSRAPPVWFGGQYRVSAILFWGHTAPRPALAALRPWSPGTPAPPRHAWPRPPPSLLGMLPPPAGRLYGGDVDDGGRSRLLLLRGRSRELSHLRQLSCSGPISEVIPTFGTLPFFLGAVFGFVLGCGDRCWAPGFQVQPRNRGPPLGQVLPTWRASGTHSSTCSPTTQG